MTLWPARLWRRSPRRCSPPTLPSSKTSRSSSPRRCAWRALCVVSALTRGDQLREDSLLLLDATCREHGVPLLVARSYGLMGFVRVSVAVRPRGTVACA